MAQRYLTSEDVRRAREGVIVVDEATLVTPQAFEAARELGVEIRTGSGAYAPPPPDRGPDAEKALRTLPHLPEPPGDADIDAATSLVVTAVGRNRAGVLAEITAALAKSGASVHDISQKMVEGFFHLVLIVEVPPGAAFDDMKRDLEALGGPDDYVCRVMHERVFRFMHRV